MKHLFSRYGGRIFQVQNNQLVHSSNKLSVDIDELLENHSHQLSENLYYLSSYEIKSDLFGELSTCPRKALKICSFDHDFSDLSFQEQLEASTCVYMMPYAYPNVIATIIKTVSPDVEFFIGKYKVNYDVVLLTWYRNIEFKGLNYISQQEILESTLLVLFQQMGITSLMDLQPSNTAYGRKISNAFIGKSQGLLDEVNEYKTSFSDLLKREFPIL